MNRSLDSLIFKAKAILCACVLAAAPFAIIGCGTAPTASMPLADRSEIFQKLMGTPFAGARQIAVDSSNQSFRVNGADPNAWITGTYATIGNGPAYVSSLTLATAGQVATFNFNANKEITSIVNSRGVWQRPANAAAGATSAPKAAGARSQSEIDLYVAANSDLLAQARQADEQIAQGQLPASSDPQVKVSGQSLGELFWILAGAAFAPYMVFSTILWVVDVVVLINAIF